MTTRPSKRSAFTLVELLIVMTVIGILIGMLAAAIVPAFTRAREFTIQLEMTQLEQSVERFKTKYGFYPPAFKNMTNGADLLPYLNKIAPNHEEGNGDPSGSSELKTWWDDNGMAIKGTPGSDLVFWLAGMNKNKQNPLSGTGEKEVFYDFKADQLDNSFGGALTYVQPSGKRTPFLYMDSGSYAPSSPTSDDGAYVASVDTTTSPDTITYYNPNSFQIISAGMDGLLGDINNPNLVTQVGAGGTDNMANFAEGRLERVLLGTK